MALLEVQPSAALQEFIRVYRIVHFVFDSRATLPFKAYPPRAEHCLSFYPKDTETVSYTKSTTKISNLKSVLMGQQSEITNRYVGNDFLVFQIVFRPGALFRITGIPSYELTNSYINAETIFPKEIKNINEQLHQAKDYVQMKSVIESFFMEASPKLQKRGASIGCGLQFFIERDAKFQYRFTSACFLFESTSI